MRIQLPKHGDSREIKRFILFPTVIDTTLYWLETITVRQFYHREHGWLTVDVIEEEKP